MFNTGVKERISQLDNLHDQKWYLMSILADKMLGEIRDLPKFLGSGDTKETPQSVSFFM